MAFIGLRYPVFAPIVTENPGFPMVYGTPTLLGAAMEANISWERVDNPLYGNDGIVENDNGIVSGSIKFGTDDLDDDQLVAVVGVRRMGTAPNYNYEETAASAPPGGFGYIRVKKKNNVLKFVAYWVHKTQLGLNEDNAKTKGESIEWQTPTIEGPVMGVMLDDTGEMYFRRHATFPTYAAAVAWINAIANISSDPVATPTASPAAGEVASGTEVALSTLTSGAAIYYTTNGSTPTTASTLYTAPIEVTAPVTIKAIAVKSGQPDSAVLTAAYTIAG